MIQEKTKKEIEQRLKYLRKEIEAERISYEEIAELQSLAEYIPEDDTLLREWAGIPEHGEERSLESLLVEAIGYVCDYLNEWENSDPKSYTSSDKVLMMNDFLKAVEDYGNEKLIEAIKPNPKYDK